jgi:hypothetical protein
VVEAPAVEHPGPEVLEHDVAPRGQASEQGPTFLLLEVERHRPLVAGDGRPPEAVAVAGDAPVAHRVADAGRLDLHHVGAVVAEQLPREGTGDEVAELQHPDAVERAAHESVS